MWVWVLVAVEVEVEVEVEVGRECTDNDNVENDIAIAGPERVCMSEGYGSAFLLRTL